MVYFYCLCVFCMFDQMSFLYFNANTANTNTSVLVFYATLYFTALHIFYIYIKNT